MIEVTLNQPEFEYDIHSLIKAFYPSEYVGVSAEKKEYDEPVTSRMHVEYTDDAITLRWQQGETTPAVERTFAVDPLDRPETKNRLKQNLYALLSDDRSVSAVGNAHGNPADQDSDEAARRGKKPGRDLYVYEADLFCVG